MRNRREWASTLNLVIIILIYSFIVSLAVLGEHFGGFTPWLILPFIAGLQNHLQILQHEGAHFNLCSHRGLNDLFTNLFCTLPFFGWLRHYRHFHFLHHKHLLDPSLDPEIEFYREQGYHFVPMSRAQKLSMFLKDLSGYHFLQFTFSFNRYLFTEGRKYSKLKLSSLDIILMILVFIMMAIIPFRLLLQYWLLPQATWLFYFMKIHGMSEHSLRTDSISTCTYNNQKNLLGRFFISPLRSYLHKEHHLRPQIPWYRLVGPKP